NGTKRSSSIPARVRSSDWEVLVQARGTLRREPARNKLRGSSEAWRSSRAVRLRLTPCSVAKAGEYRGGLVGGMKHCVENASHPMTSAGEGEVVVDGNEGDARARWAGDRYVVPLAHPARYRPRRSGARNFAGSLSVAGRRCRSLSGFDRA